MFHFSSEQFNSLGLLTVDVKSYNSVNIGLGKGITNCDDLVPNFKNSCCNFK